MTESSSASLQFRMVADPLATGSLSDGAAASSITVLIIDDEIRTDDALVRSLSSYGFNVGCAQTGADGIARALSTPPHAIVLDLHLPDILGLTVLSEFRRAALKVPVIVISGWYLDSGHEEAATALGAMGFLRKPFDASDLDAAVRAAIVSQAFPCACSELVAYSPPNVSRHPSACPLSRVDDAELRTLHDCALTGDRAAADAVVAKLLPALQAALRDTFRTADDAWILDSVVEALLEYKARPTRYDPSRGARLGAYLSFASRRNLLNRIDAERRVAAHETHVAEGELIDHGPRVLPETDPDQDLAVALADASVNFTDVEREVLQLHLDGERRTPVFAGAAGLSHLAPREQRAKIKQIKDRLYHRLRRWGETHQARRGH